MEHIAKIDTAFIIALALLLGTIVQAIARHIQIPGIILLLVTGALLGPDCLNLVKPEILGEALPAIIGFAVAVILFEGGMNLQIKRLRRESIPIQKLISIGALITTIGGTLAARFILGWSWEISILFGVLVITTGPTVVNPLLRRMRLHSNIRTILEAEGVLSDPIGAIVAIVTLEIIVHPASSFLVGIGEIFLTLGFGALIGLAGGFFISLILKPKNLLPGGMANIFVLSVVLALFQVSNFLLPESGIGAVTIAGIVVGNFKTRVLEDVAVFKEQLTMMFIGLLFILLAADVRLIEVTSLGQAGIWVVVLLMFIVRPLNVAISTMGSNLNIKQKMFLSWMSPRGIIAAAVSSFFAIELTKANIPGGEQLQAMVFTVIMITVVFQGLSGGLMASLLKVRRKSSHGYVILGANLLSLELGKALNHSDEQVTFIDSNSDACHEAESNGFKVIFGNALEDAVLLRAGVEGMVGAIGLTPNEEVNLLFTNRTSKYFKTPNQYVALHLNEGHVTDQMINQSGSTILFGAQRGIDLWSVRLRRKLAGTERWRCTCKDEMPLPDEKYFNQFLPLTVTRGSHTFPVDNLTEFKVDDVVTFLFFNEERDQADAWLQKYGWVFESDKAETSTE